MDNTFRVCVAGRYYDIPTQEISPATLEALKEITDVSNTINPRDLLRVFLEACEEKNILAMSIITANQKLATLQNDINPTLYS